MNYFLMRQKRYCYVCVCAFVLVCVCVFVCVLVHAYTFCRRKIIGRQIWTYIFMSLNLSVFLFAVKNKY